MNKLAENIYGAKFDKHTKYTEHLWVEALDLYFASLSLSAL